MDASLRVCFRLANQTMDAKPEITIPQVLNSGVGAALSINGVTAKSVNDHSPL
jgi:hypothetical protein